MRSTSPMRTVALALLLLILTMGATSEDGMDIVAVIREFGFPVFVVLWFMWRIEKRLDGFTLVVQNLLTTVTIMTKTMPHIGRPPENS